MPQGFIVIDLEAIPDPGCPAPPPREGARLDLMPAAPHHQLVSGAILSITRTPEGFKVHPPRLLGGESGGDERAILLDVCGLVETMQKKGRLCAFVSWNGRGFDFAAIIARCFFHGIPTPWAFWRDYADRFRGELHLDLQDALTWHGASRASRMSAFAELCGWPAKDDMSGADVPEVWGQGEDGRAKVQAYNLSDVACEAAILLRHLYCRGDLSRGQYDWVARDLLAVVDKEPRLASLAGRVNRKRWLLEPEGEQAGGAAAISSAEGGPS